MTGCIDCGRRTPNRRCKYCRRDHRQSSFVEPVLDDWDNTDETDEGDDA